MRRIEGIVIHCSATQDGKEVSREQIEREHKARGFRTIGYHYLIEPSGLIFVGRTEGEIGSHVSGHNAFTIGVCMIGTKRFTPKAWDALKKLCNELLAKYKDAYVKGHRDFSPDLDGDGQIEPKEWIKLCPNFDVASWKENGMTPLKENVL